MTDGDSNPILLCVCEKNNTELCNLMLNFDCDVNAANDDGITALHVTAKAGLAELAGLLLASGADVNRTDSLGETPLMKALYFDPSEELFNVLLIDADVNIGNADYETALHISVHMNLVKESSVLIGNGTNVNLVDINGNTALHCACQHKMPNPLMVKLLLEAKCCPNMQTRHKISPLHILAVNVEAIDCLSLLLEHPSINLDPVTDNHQTPLFAAVEAQNFDNVRLLLQANCDVNMKGCSLGNMPQKQLCSVLDMATSLPNTRLIKLLLLAGASSKNGYQDITKLLCKMLQGSDCSLLIEKPVPLQQLCRLMIRKILGRQPEKKANTLFLPVAMKEYVALKDLDVI